MISETILAAIMACSAQVLEVEPVAPPPVFYETRQAIFDRMPDSVYFRASGDGLYGLGFVFVNRDLVDWRMHEIVAHEFVHHLAAVHNHPLHGVRHMEERAANTAEDYLPWCPAYQDATGR